VLLPDVGTLQAYRRVYRDEAVWLPAMQEICRRQGLGASGLAFAPPGTHVVFRVGADRYIKLFSPLWGTDFGTERTVLDKLSARSDLPVPRLVAEGEVEGWPYLVMTAVRGIPLNQAWRLMGQRDRVHICHSCGALMAALHATSTEGMDAIAVDWPAFVESQLEDCVESVRKADLGDRWDPSVRAFLTVLPPLYEPGFRPVLLSADVTDEHILVSKRNKQWELTGFIDFGDAMLGHPLYEFAAPGCSITRGEPELQQAMLRAYGFSEVELNERLARQLMAYTLVHRYITISDLLEMLPSAQVTGFEGVWRAIWAFA
jgi:hygromycin-B 7''-O-kinase